MASALRRLGQAVMQNRARTQNVVYKQQQRGFAAGAWIEAFEEQHYSLQTCSSSPSGKQAGCKDLQNR